MIPFSFQKGNKAAGCEDAPPIANLAYSVVCDGLGGAGSTKHTVLEGVPEKPVVRTSGYLGSRIVCDCVNTYYAQSVTGLFAATNDNTRIDNVNGFLLALKEQIVSAFDANIQKWGITRSHSKTLKDFPTTLASAIYYPHSNGVTVLAVWAGDSRVYLLTPKKGLQLLSLDDAKNAENEMNSTSEMTNCISAGNAFRLNYAFYELNEPGIVFCCSDGCFDYLQSPLHFEWLLLHTILECMPNSTGDELGVALAESIRDNMYKSIGDDTTMSGIIIGMNSSRQMKDLYQGRMSESGKLAVSMNDCLKEFKTVQNERDAAQKTCRLFEEKILSSVHDEVCLTLKSSNVNPPLRARLISMPCYTEYTQREWAVEKEINDECALEVQKIQEMAYQTRNVCRSMLICDYLKWQRQVDEQGGASSTFWGQLPMFPPKTRGQARNGQAYSNPTRARQSILACIEMYKHPYFKEIASLPAFPNNEIEKYIQSQMGQLEAVLAILDNSDSLFTDLWSQAYFSTDYFSKERYQCDRNPQFDVLFEQTINSPQSCQFVSGLSARKIAEYHEQGNGIAVIREKYAKEKQRRLDNVPEEYWANHKNEILEMILSENENTLRSLFGNTTMQMERLVSYVEAKRTLAQIDRKIEAAQISVDRIWDRYKDEYQLFRQVTEKGVC